MATDLDILFVFSEETYKGYRSAKYLFLQTCSAVSDGCASYDVVRDKYETSRTETS